MEMIQENNIIETWVAPFFVGILLLFISYYYLNKDTTKQTVNNSPQSINTINQSGGSNTINHYGPRPEISKQVIEKINERYEGSYKHTFGIVISNPGSDVFELKCSYRNTNMCKFLPIEEVGAVAFINGVRIGSASYRVQMLTKNKILENEIKLFL